MITWIKNKFNTMNEPDTTTIMIAGLGNPGKEYAETRHNMGFMVVSKIATRLGAEFTRLQNKAFVTKAVHGDQKLILVKPQTFMNNSGQAVSALMRFYKLPLENLLVIYDDVDLDYEVLRLRANGSSSGQKGMNSIIQQLGSDEIPRLRVGIGRPPGRMPTPKYVLQRFSKEQEEILPFVIDRAADAALDFVSLGIIEAMNRYNQKPESI
jgi:PTH1 family peptidyl-tRNA hydrolase